jgi:hypothetical protein
MNPLEQRISTLANWHAVIADRTAELKVQFLELEWLRDRLGQALRSAGNRCNRTATLGMAPVLIRM